MSDPNSTPVNGQKTKHNTNQKFQNLRLDTVGQATSTEESIPTRSLKKCYTTKSADPSKTYTEYYSKSIFERAKYTIDKRKQTLVETVPLNDVEIYYDERLKEMAKAKKEQITEMKKLKKKISLTEQKQEMYHKVQTKTNTDALLKMYFTEINQVNKKNDKMKSKETKMSTPKVLNQTSQGEKRNGTSFFNN